jgi:hypothetical protein
VPLVNPRASAHTFTPHQSPKSVSPDEVARDIVAQAQVGYDLIKFHELFGTTTGLSLPAYRSMIQTTRRIGLPLVGHAPLNLGVDEMLAARQSIAHLGMLSNIYFLPLISHKTVLVVTAGTMLALICFALTSGAAVIRHSVKGPQPDTSGARKTSKSAILIAITAVGGFLVASAFFPGGPLFNSTFLRAVFTTLAGIIMVATLVVGFHSVRLLRNEAVPILRKVHVLLTATIAVALTVAMLAFWVPVSWRTSDGAINRLARRVHDVGMFVQSTLVVYETYSTSGRTALIEDPAIAFLIPSIREKWREEPKSGIPLNRLTAFNQSVAGALHRNGVPIMGRHRCDGSATGRARQFTPQGTLSVIS